MLFLKPITSYPDSSLRAIIVIEVAWCFFIYVIISKLGTQHVTEMEEQTNTRLNQVLQELKHSIQQRQEFRKIIGDILSDKIDKHSGQKLIEKLQNKIQNKDGGDNKLRSKLKEPSVEYELIRRRIRYNTLEMWNYFRNELAKIRMKVAHEMPKLEREIRGVMNLAAEHKRSLLTDIDHLQQLDGYEQWRQEESRELSELVQRRLNFLQNPKDCKAAKKLICNIDNECGFGCALHHNVDCFIEAYATERTMLLNSKGWSYQEDGWETVFKPITNTCLGVEAMQTEPWPGKPDMLAIEFPKTTLPKLRSHNLPSAIPEDLAPRLIRLHGDPVVWWVGQFLKYLMQAQQSVKDLLESSIEKYGWKRPIVGVHVRRTDKVGTEASFHKIEEYMPHVEDYYLTLETNGTKQPRRIYLATDDVSVINETRMKYPQYEIICDQDIAKMADVSTRYSNSSLYGIILDLHMLSISDYLVCTISSTFCRIAYEVMQTLYPDAAHRFKSLDDVYFYAGQRPHKRRAIIAHTQRYNNEIGLQIGDLIQVAGNHWNGYSKGRNLHTNQRGMFPSFKTVNKILVAKMPTYSHL